MPPRKKSSAAPPPLSDDEVASLRARVQAGEKPRVVVRTASAAVPAGTRGNIVRIGNPSEGEYVVVRLGKDEVPFAPSELAMSGRATQTAATPAPGPARATPAPANATKATKATKATRAAKASATPATAVAEKASAPAPAKAAPVRKSPAKAAAAVKKTPAAKKTGSRRTPPPLVVTLRFDDGEWTVEAARGARRLAKSNPVRPGAVKAFADLLDEPTVREALSETIESCRSVVEERAAALRAELLAAEAALKEYEARRR